MHDFKLGAVIGNDGLTGVLLDPLPHRLTSDHSVRIELADGRVIQVPADMLVVGSDGTYLIPVGFQDIEHRASAVNADEPVITHPTTKQDVIPVLAEKLVLEKKPVQTGGVRVTRRVLEHDEKIEMPLQKEHLDVRRVVVDREVDGLLPVRRQGETTIIPIVEEVLVVQKRYRLKEEIHITRTMREELHQEQVTLRRQQAEIEQFDAEGHRRSVQPQEAVARPVARTRRRRSILGDS